MKLIKIVFAISFSLTITSCAPIENSFQQDADQIRLEHLAYWSGLVEEYYEIKGYYPFQEELKQDDEIGLVKISSKRQRSYLSPGSENYNIQLDNNSSGQFTEVTVATFVKELENGLDRTIAERYDIQEVPMSSPVGYFYFFTSDGYLIWTTCITCDVTLISTLLFDGYTPTVNIASEGMKDKVNKALLREEMLTHPIFKRWVSKGFKKEEYVRSIVAENESDSKL